MISSVSPVVVLALYPLLHPVALAARSAECRALPQNIQAERDLRPAIAHLLARSRTLRSQCLRIAASPATRVSITVSLSPMGADARARSYARRYESGLLVVDVQLPPASPDFVELLAHELEHVTEFIDDIDFRTLLAARRGAVVQNHTDGSFESDRARDAGIRAAAEVAAETDESVAALTHGFSRVCRTVARFARAGFRQ